MERALRKVSVAVLACLPLLARSQPPATDGSAAAGPPSAGRGEQLFSGALRFRSGGPACAACHAIAALPFPGGGSLGPDLSGEYAKLGPEGMAVALETLYFPAMAPIYERHLLAPDERRDLAAFIQASSAPARGNTLVLLVLAAAGCGLWLVIAGAVWRDRVRGVRRRLVHGSARGGSR